VNNSLAQALFVNRNYRFWICQLLGWTGYSLATFFSITLLDNNVSWPHVEHIAIQAALGILCTWPLRPLYRKTFQYSLPVRIVVSTIAVIAFSALWTAMRIQTFSWMSGETQLWREFNYWYFGSLFVFLSWTGLYYGITYYELFLSERRKLLEESAQRERERSRRLQAEFLAREAQLRMLRYQLNPHFLFNTLNTINALVRLGDATRAGEMLQLLSRFLRHSLEHGDETSTTLDRELVSLMLYLDIEKARFEDRLNLEMEIEEATKQAVVPSFILQPIVENSMKYAIGMSEQGGTVSIAARKSGGDLLLEIVDTGPGIANLEDEVGRGVGLRNTLDRLRALYENEYSFSANNLQPSGLCVQIRFPYATQSEIGHAGALQ
jgi:sensor histidine kinase YesM